MILYGYFRSSSAWRCRIALNLLGVDPERRYVHLTRDGGEQRTEGYAAVNPQKLVPALEVDGGTITQSLAIIEYLDEVHGGNLVGSTPMERADIRGFSQIIACDIQPLQNLRVLQYIAAEYGQSETGQRDAWCRKWLGDGLAACEAIARRGSGRFAFGDAPTMADICLVPQMASADRFAVDTEGFPRLREIAAACGEMPEFADAAPASQPDAE